MNEQDIVWDDTKKGNATVEEEEGIVWDEEPTVDMNADVAPTLQDTIAEENTNAVYMGSNIGQTDATIEVKSDPLQKELSSIGMTYDKKVSVIDAKINAITNSPDYTSEYKDVLIKGWEAKKAELEQSKISDENKLIDKMKPVPSATDKKEDVNKNFFDEITDFSNNLREGIQGLETELGRMASPVLKLALHQTQKFGVAVGLTAEEGLNKLLNPMGIDFDYYQKMIPEIIADGERLNKKIDPFGNAGLSPTEMFEVVTSAVPLLKVTDPVKLLYAESLFAYGNTLSETGDFVQARRDALISGGTSAIGVDLINRAVSAITKKGTSKAVEYLWENHSLELTEAAKLTPEEALLPIATKKNLVINKIENRWLEIMSTSNSNQSKLASLIDAASGGSDIAKAGYKNTSKQLDETGMLQYMFEKDGDKLLKASGLPLEVNGVAQQYTREQITNAISSKYANKVPSTSTNATKVMSLIDALGEEGAKYKQAAQDITQKIGGEVTVREPKFNRVNALKEATKQDGSPVSEIANTLAGEVGYKLDKAQDLATNQVDNVINELGAEVDETVKKATVSKFTTKLAKGDIAEIYGQFVSAIKNKYNGTYNVGNDMIQSMKASLQRKVSNGGALNKSESNLATYLDGEMTMDNLINIKKEATTIARTSGDATTVMNASKIKSKAQEIIQQTITPDEFQLFKNLDKEYVNRSAMVGKKELNKLGVELLKLANGKQTLETTLASLDKFNIGDIPMKQLEKVIGTKNIAKIEKAIVNNMLNKNVDDVSWSVISKSLNKMGFVSQEGKSLKELVNKFDTVFTSDNFTNISRLSIPKEKDAFTLTADLLAKAKYSASSKIWKMIKKYSYTTKEAHDIRAIEEITDVLSGNTAKVRALGIDINAAEGIVRDSIKEAYREQIRAINGSAKIVESELDEAVKQGLSKLRGKDNTTPKAQEAVVETDNMSIADDFTESPVSNQRAEVNPLTGRTTQEEYDELVPLQDRISDNDIMTSNGFNESQRESYMRASIEMRLEEKRRMEEIRQSTNQYSRTLSEQSAPETSTVNTPTRATSSTEEELNARVTPSVSQASITSQIKPNTQIPIRDKKAINEAANRTQESYTAGTTNSLKEEDLPVYPKPNQGSLSHKETGQNVKHILNKHGFNAEDAIVTSNRGKTTISIRPEGSTSSVEMRIDHNTKEISAYTMGFESGSGQGEKYYSAVYDYARLHGYKYVPSAILTYVNKVRTPINLWKYALDTGYYPAGRKKLTSLMKNVISDTLFQSFRAIKPELDEINNMRNTIGNNVEGKKIQAIANMTDEELVELAQRTGASSMVRAGEKSLKLFREAAKRIQAGKILSATGLSMFIDEAYKESNSKDNKSK